MHNPYETLGVPRDATSAQVRVAFRQRAKAAHPDAGGNNMAFDDLCRAHKLLLDPRRREKFDKTGIIEEESADNAQAALINIVMGAFMGAAQQFALGKLRNPSTFDMVQFAEQQISLQIREIEKNLQIGLAIAETLRRVEHRLHVKKKKSNSLLNQALKAQAKGIEEHTEKLTVQIAQHNDALKFLRDYRFDPEVVQQHFTTTVGSVAWTR